MRQDELALTLDELPERGRRDFYDGDLAARLADAFERLGVAITPNDLSQCRAVLEEPLMANIGGCTLWTSPPNSQGYLLLTTMLTTMLAAEEIQRRGGQVDPQTLLRLFAHGENRRAIELADPRSMSVDVSDLLAAQAISADVIGLQAPQLSVGPRTAMRPGW